MMGGTSSIPKRPSIRKKGREYECDWGGFGLSTGATRAAAYDKFLTTWIGKIWAEKLAAGGPGVESAT